VQPLDERTSAAMAKVRQARTTPEEAVASALRVLGASYRRNVKTLPGKPDFANRSRGWVVLVHGCFWHQHDCKRGTIPAHNREAWLAKFARNKQRDSEVEAALEASGLRVLTVWECETRNHQSLVDKLATYLG
jgi:DNA mismatch endonuclease (patch repair protein)